MLSTEELRKILAIKRKDLEIEKAQVGLPTHGGQPNGSNGNLKQEPHTVVYNVENTDGPHSEVQNEPLPGEIIKLMRKHSGLPPIMLKAGEYSPNNPLLRSDSEPYCNDIFLGLGEYEERKKRMRKIKQQEYKRFLDMQNEQKKMLVHQLQKRKEPTGKRSHVKQTYEAEKEREKEKEEEQTTSPGAKGPISIGVQTDESELAKLSDIFTLKQPFVKEAEKELSPRRVLGASNRLNDGMPDTVGTHTKRESQTQTQMVRTQDVRYKAVVQDFAKENREGESKSVTILPSTERSNRRGGDIRPAYVPTLFDEEVIRQRNMKAEQDAVEKRLSYQKELRDQILEQQRFREERKAREKLYEEAERRRLEEQLKVIKLAQDTEVQKHQNITATMAANSRKYEVKRKHLEEMIDTEKKNITRSRSQPLNMKPLAVQGKLHTANSEKFIQPSNLPLYYAYSPTILSGEKLSTLMQMNKNDQISSNLTKSTTFLPRSVEGIDFGTTTLKEKLINSAPNSKELCDSLINRPDVYRDDLFNRNPEYEPTFLNKEITDLMVLTSNNVKLQDNAPNLGHSPRKLRENRVQSDEMKKVEGKWRVPAVQKNIVKKIPDAGGEKTTNILTQLGSIRRQLQLEQMKLDKLLSNNNNAN